ncbi:Phage shock protein PspC (stress-responsive transcriptional regulator) [Leifsonia sp. 98AMF]|uniref:PspC domain-containing protein n=1 Tax=Microbacteriaceae TaxID=85023 RepID=UPI000490505A|nr:MULTISPECIES: PspC domain-containing protein [Microbacteriaceae]TDQ01863.1 phage shock protein C (PspC) family protein [Leifsonia sp. 115AMFTsu3.1]SDG98882.1 Phage shock protein PspC (stress-responsive transcriptional regulator) [Leifsonia sp. 197AMF]SDJ42558.1 Phage shock protein PspC (stress-responsive transcriptional regulator) [Leifsonia sp. 466MF]SDK34238.1 Phage shock protein PspC (stress-responsive transcriptional regulator) [Leifsonia sp. 157MF]SDN63025.1 Phage shock protein PspC (s
MSTLMRPRDGRVIAGVCAGLANRFGLRPWTVRVLFLLSCLLPGPQFIAYLVMWIVIPGEQGRGAATV